MGAMICCDALTKAIELFRVYGNLLTLDLPLITLQMGRI